MNRSPGCLQEGEEGGREKERKEEASFSVARERIETLSCV